MKRDQWILTFAVGQASMWLLVLLHRSTDMKDAWWPIPMAGVCSSVSLCLMLYLRFKAKGAEPR